MELPLVELPLIQEMMRYYQFPHTTTIGSTAVGGTIAEFVIKEICN